MARSKRSGRDRQSPETSDPAAGAIPAREGSSRSNRSRRGKPAAEPEAPLAANVGASRAASEARPVDSRPRIIGGRFRGRKIAYSGDVRTRPMKERVREAIFNLLGPDVKQKHAVDLFAGTGALGLEAVSRGAASAMFCERHFPTADLIRQTARELGCDDLVRVHAGDTFFWWSRQRDQAATPADRAWVVFCSPPYALYVDRRDDLLELLSQAMHECPPRSLVAVEADERFDFGLLPSAAEWDVRPYPPAIVGIWQKSTEGA